MQIAGVHGGWAWKRIKEDACAVGNFQMSSMMSRRGQVLLPGLCRPLPFHARAHQSAKVHGGPFSPYISQETNLHYILWAQEEKTLNFIKTVDFKFLWETAKMLPKRLIRVIERHQKSLGAFSPLWIYSYRKLPPGTWVWASSHWTELFYTWCTNM